MSTLDTKRPAFGLPGRIQDPNSKPRTIALVGLGEGGAGIARRVSAQDHPNLQVHVLAKSSAGMDSVAAIQAGGGDLHRDLMAADMVFIVCAHGDDVALAQVVGTIAHSRNRSVTALYIVPTDRMTSGDDDETLRALRKSVEMLVVVSDETYVPAMIAALGT